MQVYVKLKPDGIELHQMEQDEQGNVEDTIYTTECMWAHLRERCILDGGITVGKLFDVVNKDESLLAFMEMAYPAHKHILDPGQPIIDIVLRKTFQWVESEGASPHVYIETHAFQNGKKKFHPASEISLSSTSEFQVPKGSIKGESDWTLLEILDAIYGSYQKRYELTPNGLYELDLAGKRTGEPRNLGIPYLSQACMIAPGTRVADIMAFVENADMMPSFISMYSWCSHIDKWHSDARRPPKVVDGRKFERVEIRPIADISDNPEGFEQFFEGFAVQIDEPEMVLRNIGLREYTHLPISVLPLQIIRNGELSTVNYTVTLLDIIDTIYYQIDFFHQEEQEAARFIMQVTGSGGDDADDQADAEASPTPPSDGGDVQH